MRTSKYILLAVVFAALAGSCEQDNEWVAPRKKSAEQPGKHPITIGAGYEWGGATRAELNTETGVFSWTAGDEVGLTITPAGSTAPIAHNVQMSGNHTSKVEQTTFTGRLTDTQYAALDLANQYDYYTYYPYRPGLGGTFPNVQFTIPSTVTVKPNVFNPDIAPMVAKRQTGSPQVFLSGSNIGYDDLDIHFRYDHVMSYAAIEMDMRLLPDNVKVNSITITCLTSTMSGNLELDMTYTGSNPVCQWANGGSNSITVNIDGGLTAGSGDKIYVPIYAKSMVGQTLSFQFNTGGGTYNYMARNVPGINFERGKIHSLKIAPAAEYRGNASFTVTKEGYYYVEAWGGNGGRGTGGSDGNPNSDTDAAKGGISQKIDGIYKFNVGDVINLYIGAVGVNGTSQGGTVSSGGGNGSSFGSGGQGGQGGTSISWWPTGGNGGGGGAGTFMFLNGTSTGNIRLVSGGGGGGGGRVYRGIGTDQIGGKGGDGIAITDGQNGSNGNDGAVGGKGTGTGGDGGGAGGGGGTGSTASGGSGGSGQSNVAGNAGGAGGGGGGGGYNHGGGGGEGGSVRNSGGGGAGGASYRTGNSTDSGKTAPTGHTRANGTNGYVIITPLR